MGQICTICRDRIKSAPSVEDVLSRVSTLRRTTSQQRSVYCAARPLYLVSNLVGLAPFSCSSEERGKGASVASRLFVILCCILHIGGTAVIYRKKLFGSPSSKPAKLNFSNTLFFTAGFVTAIFSLVTASTSFRKHLPKVLFKVSRVDRILLKYGNGRNVYITDRVLVAHVVLAFVITTSVYIWDYFLFCGNKGYECPLKLGFRLFASLTNVVMVLQLIFSSLLLRQKFRAMNLLLKSWFSRRAREGTFLDCEIKDIEMLRQVRKAYVLLHEASSLVSSHFGVPVLLACMWLFLGVLTNLSFVLEMAMKWSQGHSNFLQMTCFDLVISGGSLILLEEISIACHLTAAEAHHTGVLLQKVLVRHGSILHEHVENELERFSCQAERMKVHFSAAGFFPLDVPFFYGVIGVTCTYLTVMAEIDRR